jgi:hypothetical protein
MIHGSAAPSGFALVGNFVQQVQGGPPIRIDVFRKN